MIKSVNMYILVMNKLWKTKYILRYKIYFKNYYSNNIFVDKKHIENHDTALISTIFEDLFLREWKISSILETIYLSVHLFIDTLEYFLLQKGF